MATGASGPPMASALGRVAAESSWQSANAAAQHLPMKGSSVRGFVLSTAPVLWTLAPIQVRLRIKGLDWGLTFHRLKPLKPYSKVCESEAPLSYLGESHPI